jgi:hypothetical protein
MPKPLANRLFYILSVDCTNFISQCVWAGYVGFDPDDLTTFKNYISNKIGIVYDEWYAGIGGGSDNWEGVKDFFEYMVTSKSAGPNATTDFTDYDTKRYYTNISAATINVGDVVQLWISDSKGYDHSIFITDKTDNTSDCDYSELYYSAHTNSRYNIKLTYALTYNPYIRRLTPAATCYLKTN